MKGQVYKVHTDSYSVCCDKKVYKCKARGSLKKRGSGISVGDFVMFDCGVVFDVLDRKNKFIRPNVANVDIIICVISPEPKPDFYLVDKLLISAIKEDVKFVIVVNKSDVDNSVFETINSEYGQLGLDIIEVSAKTGLGIERLKSMLDNKLAVLAGQSAVGKTSIVNAMFGLDLKIGDLSDKISRGKHTTTRSEIFEFGNTKIIDSPGFTVIDAMIKAEELPEYYPEYFNVSTGCKFRECKHIREPNCKVKELVNEGCLSASRYERYLEIYKELQDRREVYEKD